MNKILILLILLIALFIIMKNYYPKPVSLVTIDGKVFSVDIAKTDLQKEKGLAIYNTLPSNRGMIFPFQKPGYYNFWMKDMKFPIDIIYIKNNQIVDIFKDVLPPTKSEDDRLLPILKPHQPADTVLEINAGLSTKYNFKIGDKVK